MALHLAVQASVQHIRFILIQNEQVYRSYEVSLPGQERNAREVLDAFFNEQNQLANHEGEISLSWSSLRSTLVPGAIFNESNPAEIYRLCYGDAIHDEIDYNRLAEHGIVHIYDLPLWIKRYFVLRFPRIVIQHEGTHILRKVMLSAFKLKANLVLHSDHFRLSIVKHNQLEYYGSFGFQNWEDVVYHLLFTLQQKEFTGQEGLIELTSGPEVDDQLLAALHVQLGRIRELEKMQKNIAPDYLALSQLLCV